MSGRRQRADNHLRVVGERRGDPAGLPRVEPPPNNLPAETSSFIGRERELAEARDLLAGTRLLTLIGAGGCGKTRLALRLARTAAATGFQDGIWWVALASLSDSRLVPQAVARAIGVREAPGRSLVELVAERIGAEEALLVLDNCEHLAEGCAGLSGSLLGSCPNLQVLDTSRETLGVAGERVWVVPPLSVPDGGLVNDPEAVLRHDSVRLFVERASAASGAFALTEENAGIVAELCERLDGIPLAIELAAARTRVLSVGQILARLEDRFRLLSGGGRAVLPQHRTLRAAMDWGHELLGREEKILFHRLSAFAGGFSLSAVEEVCSGESLEREDVLDVLSRLVDKSLVVVVHGGAADLHSYEARYRMLQTVRQYALERLDELGEEEEVRGRHAGFFLALAEEAEPELRGPRQVAWMKRLGAEQDNLRAALRWLLSKAEWEMVARLGWALWWFWWLPARFTEGRRWMEEALEKGSATMPVSARARALFVAGVMAAGQDDHCTAQLRIEESLRLFEELEDKQGTALALEGASIVAIGQGRLEEGLAFLEKSGNLYMEVGDKWGAAAVHSFSATVWLALGDHGRAERLARRGLELSREVGDAGVVGTPLYILASLAHAADDNVCARGVFGEAVEIGAQVWDWSNVAYCMEGLASVAASEGGMERAARLWGAAEAMIEHTKVMADVHAPIRSLNQGGIGAARATLGEAAFAAAWADGRAMTPEEAVAYALEEPQESPSRSARGLLSAREIEVLRFVAEGLTDAEIAERLYLSRHTVGNHLRSVYRKLDARGRAAAVKRAGELGLL
jgi:predicted ATPase/DNA-binding CsgD family transcriptional regulator